MKYIDFWINKDNESTEIYSQEKYSIKLSNDFCIKSQKLQTIQQKSKDVPFGIIFKNKRSHIFGEIFPFRVAIYDNDYIATYDMKKHQTHDQDQRIFSQDHFKVSSPTAIDQHLGFSPIIHIIPRLKWEDFEDGIKPAERFFRITDSSIWNYFVADKADFDIAIKDIRKNWNNKYYYLYIAKEFADLNARLTVESYLYEFGTQKGHAGTVSPFLFHSEQILKKKREEEYEDFKNKGVNFKEYKWRILLVDDRIDNAYLQPREYEVSKDTIIHNRIEYLFGEGTCERVFLKDDKIENVFNSIHDNNKTKVVILCVDNIEKAKVALKNYKFDFILLDYLLDRDDPKNEAEKRRYGYELLKDLKNDLKQYIIGPSNRYFFMFISAFTTAISERLRLEGLFRSEKYWHIAEGACPTNTPELFCYNLQKMMIKRIEDAGIETISNDKILDTVKDIYAHEDIDSVRKQANDKYHDILNMWYYYDKIRKDVKFPEFGKSIFTTNQSVLMTSYLQGKRSIGGLLEHLVNLVHLTAFGTARQWPELWEECRFFTRTFECKDEKQGQKLREISKKIEDYIINLKSE